MNSPRDLDNCLSFISCQLQGSRAQQDRGGKFTAVTISRQAGSGGHALAKKLAERFQTQEPQPSRPWTVFDRNLVERVLEDHNLPARLAKFLPEDHISEISGIMDDLFGLHPPSWILVRQSSETILRLAELGNVILIGRGANVITSRLTHVFHVRLVGSLHKRVSRLQEINHLTRKEALTLAKREDRARQRYLKQFFDKNINDPLLYHLVVNTDLTSIDEAARMIALELQPRVVAMSA